MASLVFNHGSYFAVFSVSNKNIWKKIGKVDKKIAILTIVALITWTIVAPLIAWWRLFDYYPQAP